MEKESFTREELYKLVWEVPLIQLAKKYNISDNGLRKKCKKHNIPLPPIGYWPKLKYGKKVRRTPLPKSEESSNVINLYYDEEVNVDDYHVPFMLRLNQIKKEIETSKILPQEIPSRLTNPDKLILSTKEYLQGKKKDDFYLHSSNNNDILDIQVSKASQNRALLIMDYFIKLVRARGHDVIIEYGQTQVVIHTVKEDISIREKYPYKKYETSGNLVFRAKPSYHKTWYDSKTVPLEQKLMSILAWLETNAREIKAHWDANARRKMEEEERKRIKQEIKERKENEIRKFTELLDEAERWHKVKFIREYIEYLEKNNIQNHEDFQNWLIWAKDKADWYDPLVKKSDTVLDEYNSNILD